MDNIKRLIMKSTYLIFALFIIFSSCKENQKALSSNKILLDSIKCPKDIIIKENCVHKTKGYYERFGLIISNYYNTIETNTTDYDKDGYLDTIAIIKPFYKVQSEYQCYPSESNSDNILVIIKTVKTKNVFFKKFTKVLSIKDENLGIEDIESNVNGFVISGDWGHSNKLFSSVYVSYKKNDFYVDSLKIESLGIHQYNRTYKYDNLAYPLSKYKREVIDSLQSVNEKL